MRRDHLRPPTVDESTAASAAAVLGAHVTTYWHEHYVSANGHCSLCGNIGVIDTRAATTYAGVSCGRLNFCICPNGQELRRLHARPRPARYVGPDALLRGRTALTRGLGPTLALDRDAHRWTEAQLDFEHGETTRPEDQHPLCFGWHRLPRHHFRLLDVEGT